MTTIEPMPLAPVESLEHPVIDRLAQDVGLGEGARRGGLWLAGSSWGAQAFQFLISIVMAHLLLPRQFGQTALVYAIAGFAVIFTDLGLSAAVVHAKQATEEVLSTAFWLSALSGVALTIIVSAAGFPIAALYGHPALAGLFIVVSLNFALSLGAIHLALLERTFNFRRIALIEAPSAVVGFASMPLFVWAGFGVYSIVLGPLVTTILSTILLWWTVPWHPQFCFSASAMKHIWNFSKGLVGSNALNYWSRNLDNVMLGAYVSEADLGEYNRSYNLMLLPIGQVSQVVMRGLYPALARMQDDPPRMGRAWIRAVVVAGGAFTLPLTLTMSATAPSLIRFLYGHRWDGAIPLLEILCLAAVPQMIGASCGAPYRAANKATLGFKLQIINTTTTVIAIVVGVQWGAIGVAVAILVKSCLNVWVVVIPLSRILSLSVRESLGSIFISWIPGLVVVSGELAVRFIWKGHAAGLVLGLQLLAGLVVYSAFMTLSKAVVAREMRDTVRTLLRRG